MITVRKKNKLYLTQYEHFYSYIFALVIYFVKISKFEKIQITYGDDSWVLVGNVYESLFDKLICCTLTHPGSSLIFQLIFKISESTDLFIKILFLIFCLLSAAVVNNKYLYLNTYSKLIFLSLILNSPMLMNYSLRPKPYIMEALITIYILSLLQKALRESYLPRSTIILFSLFLFISLITIIPIIAFFIVLLRKRKLVINESKFLHLFFSIYVLGISYFSFLRKSDELDNFWIAYFAPQDGGFNLFFRWLYYSGLRIFSESNKLDLGASDFTILLSVVLFLLGLYYLIFVTGNASIFEFIFYIFVINIGLSIFRVFPFGGSRVNIYYMILIIYIMSFGVYYLVELLPLSNAPVTMVYVVLMVYSINSLSISYNQTTRGFDQQAASQIINFVNTTNEDVIIYHGGLWTIGTFFEKELAMENVSYPWLGSGVSNIPTPDFNQSNIHIVCRRYKDEGHCFEKMKKYLIENNFTNIYLASIHTREYQNKEYMDAFDNQGYKKEVKIFEQEAKLIRFYK